MHFNHLLQALHFVWASSKKWTVLLLLTQLLQATLPLIALYLIKLIVDSLTAGADNQGFNSVFYYLLLFGGVQLLIAIIQNYEQFISETQQQLVTDYMATIIIDKALAIDMSYYENAAYHNTFHLVQSQAMHRPVQILRNLTDLLRSGFLLISLASLLLFLHWSIALILLMFGLPIALVKWYYAEKMYDWQRERVSLEREAHYLNAVLTRYNFAKEVRIFNLGEPLKKQFIKVRKALFGEKFRIGKNKARAGFFAKGTEILAMVSTYGFITYRTFQGVITIGDLVMYFQAFQKGQVAIQQSLGAVVNLYNNRLFLTQLFEFLNVDSCLSTPSQPQVLPPVLQSGIQLKNVSFHYPDTTQMVLQHVNLNFKKGQVIALVGENGSGKTTLVKLLCRLYDPVCGDIKIDDVLIKELKINELRQRISVIYQDFAKYNFTVQDNIRIGNWGKELDKAQIETAAQQTGATDFINQFPKQYQQQLGWLFKTGTEISGGQWQKIALSRAFYKSADIIILDEPSSAIDPLAEAAIFAQLKALAKDKILILVTHRLYNLKIADQIVVLEAGRVVDQGTHRELYQRDGIYSKMFEQQVVE